MYAVKVFHGYISKNGRRTRDKNMIKQFENPREAERFADKIGGMVKKLENIE
ncbi:hypothetical protein QQG09_05080 [Melissococcus plutonius]|uniref:Uncharacterized protein n=2 Tax=Melissococcus plutonius TaxID=33970 RepID=F3Y9P0_MELPT|nr:hypothetical protein [Melissococcus plutonius]BAL62401.1 hypothetical protein MPD5_1182 [Melissococcus plutonius DAT561]AIM24756.1 hypothetical protein MEPL_c006610 [Melissococcus plutonius S1]KMT24867.1 hypothetical protein MEPL2_2c04080 [Melissococcus plutonius]KMT26504.1 hypothetical protein MEPL3_2c01710 [Melissococcus plutonius]KMT27754.1 hypothetical protein MEPL1_3c04010 [Melissococcus plutonius]